ncbi:fungal-specific transcription factor domain-containing protein [Phyllosticta citricarpa]
MSKGRLGRWKRQATRRTSMLQPRVLHPIPSLRRADEKPRSATLARLVAEGTMTCRALFLSDRRADRVSQARLFGRAEAGVDRDSCPMAGEKREGGISTTIIQCSTASAVLCLLQGLLPPAFHNLTRNCGWASSSGRQEPHCCCLPVSPPRPSASSIHSSSNQRFSWLWLSPNSPQPVPLCLCFLSRLAVAITVVKISAAAPISSLLSPGPTTTSSPAGKTTTSPAAAHLPAYPAQPHSTPTLPALPTTAGPPPQPPVHQETQRPVPEAGARRSEQPRMRSSIACARCRRSKVKCVNNGVGTTCRACETTGRECTYPSPAAAGAGASVAVAKRDSNPQAGNPALDRVTAGETPRRQPRPKKSSASVGAPVLSTRESPHALVDALDSKVLTPKVWTDLFDIFQAHYSTDLPFLHPPTFLKSLRQSSLQGATPPGFGESNSASLPALSPPLLLAFLALTARSYPQLVAHHSPSSAKQNPLIAAEYYASACRANLDRKDEGSPDLQRVQALLMLGLHEWGMCRGSKAWIAVGMAIRSAQLLGLQHETELDDMLQARSAGLGQFAQDAMSGTKADVFIEQETKRRTFWSCFIMDRFLSSGKYRPQMLNVSDLRIQLPCSERAFLFGEKVKTLMLGEEAQDVASRSQLHTQRKASTMLGSKHGSPNGGTPVSSDRSAFGKDEDEDSRWEVGGDEGILSRYVKVLDLYGRIVKWSCSGGRRREQFPPWDDRSTWSSLQKLHASFRESLPRDMTLTMGNVSAHITSRTSTPFVLMHVVQLLCGIILHRDYIPFIPLKSTRPQGPLDAPSLSPKEYTPPEGFWEQSARELFKTARDVIDLLRMCQDWGVLVESPVVGFAAYSAALAGVYAINFPWMDPHGYMSKGTPLRDLVKPEEISSGAEASRKGLELTSQMRKTLQMAEGWFRTLKRVHLYYMRIKKEHERNTKAMAAPSPPSSAWTNSSAREDCKQFEAYMRSIVGSEEMDQDLDMLDAPDTDDNRRDSGDSASYAHRDSVDANTSAPDTIRQERWNAINTVAAAAVTQQKQQTPTAAFGPGGIPISNPSPELSHSQPPPTTGQSPIISPPASSSASTGAPPLYERPSTSTGGFTPIQQLTQPYPAQNQQLPSATNMSPQQRFVPPPAWGSPSAPPPPPQRQQQRQYDAWLDGLETSFGGDDLAAFVAGTSWESWASGGVASSSAGIGHNGGHSSSPFVPVVEQGGWLSAIWSGCSDSSTSAAAAAAPKKAQR